MLIKVLPLNSIASNHGPTLRETLLHVEWTLDVTLLVFQDSTISLVADAECSRLDSPFFHFTCFWNDRSNTPDMCCPQTMSNKEALNLVAENPLFEEQVRSTPSKESSVEPRCIPWNKLGCLFPFSRISQSWKHWVKDDSRGLCDVLLLDFSEYTYTKHQWKKGYLCVSALPKQPNTLMLS